MARYNRTLFVGIKGSVLALDRSTGREIWRTLLKGGDFVNVVLDEGELFATARGEIFCLDPATGRIRWNNPLRGLGWGLITIAPVGGCSPAMEEHRRRQQAQNSSAGAAG